MNKFQIPGWRIEQKFNNKCLIGNWNEERRNFQRENNLSGNSTYRVDFSNYQNYPPDMRTRRVASIKNEGLPKKFIFSHHGNRYSNNMISWYDQHINKRDEQESTLPKLRKWDGKSTSWVPEKNDHPLQGKATRFCLLEEKKKKWSLNHINPCNEFQSTYKLSFDTHPNSAMEFQHHANKKNLSSHFHSHKINKDLALRNTHVNIGPEYPPTFQQNNCT